MNFLAAFPTKQTWLYNAQSKIASVMGPIPSVSFSDMFDIDLVHFLNDPPQEPCALDATFTLF